MKLIDPYLLFLARSRGCGGDKPENIHIYLLFILLKLFNLHTYILFLHPALLLRL
jgi:hypothetical protein